MPIEPGDRVTLDYIAFLPDGTVFDTSVPEVAEEYGVEDAGPFDPLVVEVGAGGPWEPIEEGLVGMSVGEEDTTYAEIAQELESEYGREEFTEMLDGVPPEEGQTVQAADGTTGRVVTVTEDTVTVDFSHELVGEDLEIKIRVVDIG